MERRAAEVRERDQFLAMEDTRVLMQVLVESYGCRATVATDGESAVELAMRERPAVMLVDIGLPGLDGYDVARAVRAALGSEVRLVAITGYGQPADRDWKPASTTTSRSRWSRTSCAGCSSSGRQSFLRTRTSKPTR